jgi:hypothetical protein
VQEEEAEWSEGEKMLRQWRWETPEVDASLKVVLNALSAVGGLQRNERRAGRADFGAIAVRTTNARVAPRHPTWCFSRGRDRTRRIFSSATYSLWSSSACTSSENGRG